MDQKLYSIDTDKRTPEVLVKDLKESCYKVSESNQYFAWVDSDKEYKSDVIHLMNLKMLLSMISRQKGSVYSSAWVYR